MDEFTTLNMIGQSPAFLKALKLIRRLAACDATVLIEGEIGTGKELAARAIHYLGARRHGPFIPVNCGGVPDGLFENELFGHVRGAFTDARAETGGLIAHAEGGTLFLDEVEALSPKGQVALLRFLQDRTYRPLGSKRLVDANVRIVAASNASVTKMSARGEFRADLMYRLTVMPLELPPLRERDGDVRLLAGHFVSRFNAQYELNRSLSAASLAALAAYEWPGNIRELENLLHREVLLAETDIIELGLRVPLAPGTAGRGSPIGIDFESGFQAAKALSIADFEHRFVSWALTEAGGNLSLAARRAGKERRSFSRLVKKYGLKRVSAQHADETESQTTFIRHPKHE